MASPRDVKLVSVGGLILASTTTYIVMILPYIPHLACCIYRMYLTLQITPVALEELERILYVEYALVSIIGILVVCGLRVRHILCTIESF